MIVDNKETKLLRLKTKLKLKYTQKIVDRCADENFGYCPFPGDDPTYDKFIKEREKWVDIARENFPDLYTWWDNVLNK